jgi:hypothetical protein
MSNTNRYTKAAAKGAADGVKTEWDRANTLGGVVEYALMPKQARLVYAGARVGIAATRGAVGGVKTVRSEINSEQPTELFIVPDVDAVADQA